jgi:uncharacterized phage protein gp47/JayE
MSFGLSSTGLNIKRQADIKTELEEVWQATFGKSINLDARSINGQLIGILSEREAKIWELIEQVYNSQYPDTSEGVPLDNVAAITGTERKSSTKSTGIATLIGIAGTTVPAGSIMSVIGNEDSRFVTDVDALILPGTNEQQTITFLQTPTSGSFRLQYNGTEITDPILYSEGASEIEAALEALDGIDSCTVTGTWGAGFVVEFEGQNGLSPQPDLEVVSNLLLATEIGTIEVDTTTIDGKYFLMQESAGSVAFWMDVDDSGTTIPAGAAAADRAVEITTIVTGDTVSQIATKVAAALQADAAISSASAVAEDITWTAAAAGALTDAADGDTGWNFATTTQGRDAGEITPTVTETVAGVYPKADVAITAEEFGAVQAPAGSLTVIETPVSGWESVTNELDIDVGQEVETDQELKVRRRDEIAIAGKATLPAIRAAIIALNEVTAVVIFQNKSSVTDSDDRPPHSLDIVVENGDEDEIAETIFEVVGAGIETIGDISKVVVDSQGFNQVQKFSRPDDVPIYCEVDLTVDTNEFPVNGTELVQEAILEYGDGLNIGEDVIVYVQLISSFADVPGILDVAIRIGTAPIPADGSATATAADDGSGNLEWTSSSHGLVNNNKVTFSTTNTLPSGISAGVVYHVIEADTNTFQVALKRGGDPVSFADAGTGTHTVSFGGRDDNIIIEPREVAKFDSSRTDVQVI